MLETKKVRPGTRFCFTLNNYTIEEVQLLKRLDDHKEKLKYAVGQQERGAEGTVHIQGFVVWKKTTKLTQLKKWLARAHFENAYRTTEECIAYCTKEATRLEGTEPCVWGVAPKTKKEVGAEEHRRGELALTAAKEGRLDDIPADILYRYFGNTLKIQSYFNKQNRRLEDVSGLGVQGQTGVGKSTFVEYLFGKSIYGKMGTKWFDNYKGERTIVFDDISLNHKEFGYFLKIGADRRAFQAEIKGASVEIRPLLFVVTSQYAIEKIGEADKETIGALRRRFRVIELKKDLSEEAIGDSDDVLLVTPEALALWTAKIKAEEMGEVTEELKDKSLKSLLELPEQQASVGLGEDDDDAEGDKS